MGESRGSGARRVDWLNWARVRSIRNVTREFQRLGQVRVGSDKRIGLTVPRRSGPVRERATISWRPWLGRLGGWLVMNSI
jgi:hypothetical protein